MKQLWAAYDSTDSKYLNLLFALQYFVFLQKVLANLPTIYYKNSTMNN